MGGSISQSFDICWIIVTQVVESIVGPSPLSISKQPPSQAKSHLLLLGTRLPCLPVRGKFGHKASERAAACHERTIEKAENVCLVEI